MKRGDTIQLATKLPHFFDNLTVEFRNYDRTDAIAALGECSRIWFSGEEINREGKSVKHMCLLALFLSPLVDMTNEDKVGFFVDFNKLALDEYLDSHQEKLL